MILKVYGYGHPLLRKTSEEIDENYPELQELINNMYETMYASSGIGLAAPQVGLNIRLFIIDTTQIKDFEKGTKRVFINPEIIDSWGDLWEYEEGCLSLPGIRENVLRHEFVRIRYQDENFKEKEEVFDDMNGRVILHEYDHLEGILFIDLINPLRKRMIKKQLKQIAEGTAPVDYPMVFYNKKIKI